MFRPMRRKKNEISPDSAKKLLVLARRGILTLNGEEGYPYAIPINYRYCEAENRIYFHGSRVGYKVDLLKRNDKVCFTVYGNETVKDEEWAPYVQSAVVFGRCRLIDDQDKALRLVRYFAEKYYPDSDLIDEEVAAVGKAVQMFEIEIEHISGKEIQEK